MSTFEILMILKLDIIMGWLIGAAIIMTGVFLVLLITLAIAHATREYDEEYRFTSKWMKRILWGLIIVISGTIFIPSTKEVFTALAISTVTTSDKIKNISPKLLEFIDLELDKKLDVLRKGNN